MTVWVAVDPTLRKFWIRANLDAWWGGTAPDPATGSGGIDIAFTGDTYPAMALTRPGEAATGLFAALSLEGVPTGYGEVNASPVLIRSPRVTAYIFT